MVSDANLPTSIGFFPKQLLLLLIALVVTIHAFGILLPETGFDALWYHLPIVKDMADSGMIRRIKGIPQSDQPRLGEMLFLPGFLLGGVVGVKITAFSVMILLLIITFKLSRNFLDESWALGLVLVVASFHTVAWQATSAYVDLVRTWFEVCFLYLLTRRERKSGEFKWLAILWSGALLTKLVTLLFTPAMLVLVLLKRGGKSFIGLFTLTAAVYVLGKFPLSFFLSAGHDLIGLNEVGLGIKTLVLLPLSLSFHAESYLSPIFLFVVPLFLIERKWVWRKFRVELAFLMLSILTWVFVAPISVRYDLVAIILLLILCFSVARHSLNRFPFLKTCFLLIVFAGVCLNMMVRIGALYRARSYVLGQETQVQYLQRFDSGILRGPLEKWYRVQ